MDHQSRWAHFVVIKIAADFVSLAEIESFVLSAVKLEEICLFAVEHLTNYQDMVMYFDVSFLVSVFYIVAIVDALEVKWVIV